MIMLRHLTTVAAAATTRASSSCHILSTTDAAAAVASSTASSSSSSASGTATNDVHDHVAINHLQQSNILHLLGQSFTRTFRCIWMLEEINEEYYINNNLDSNKKQDHHGMGNSSSNSGPIRNIPYYLIYNAKPLSSYVRQFQSTGKIPLLVEYPFVTTTDNTSTNHNNTTNLDTTTITNEPFVLSEASAINTYLYDQYGYFNTISGFNKNGNENNPSSSQQQQQQPLVPYYGTKLRGQYDALVSCICMELDAQGLWIHRKHNGDKMSQALSKGLPPNPNAVQLACDQYHRMNIYLSSLLNPYLLGSQFTAVDILYMHCLEWGNAIGWDTTCTTNAIDQKSEADIDSSNHGSKNDDNNTNNHVQNIQKYMELCQSRPAYQRAIQIRNQTIRTTKTTAHSSESKL